MKFRGCAESVMMPTFSMTMATASEAMKPVTCGAPRIGRKAMRSISMPTPRSDHQHDDDGHRKRRIDGGHARQHREGADGHDVAMGEIDKPHDPVDQREADRDQRIHAAENDAVGDLLEDIGAAHETHSEISALHFASRASALPVPESCDEAGLQHIGAVGEIERHSGVLLDQQHGRALVADALQDVEDLLHQPRRQAQRGLVQQQQLAAGSSERDRSPASSARRPKAGCPGIAARSSRIGKRSWTARRSFRCPRRSLRR